MHFSRDPLYFFHFVINYFNPKYIPAIRYFPIDTVKTFLTEGKSIIRFGDGEIFILNGGSLPGQEFNQELKEKMYQCISEYSKASNYVLCLNRTPLAKSNKQLQKEGLIPCWLPSKVFFNLYFKKEEQYLDAAMFYYGSTIPTYFEEYLMGKQLLLISNEDNVTRFKSNHNIPFKNVTYITTPSKNAYAQYQNIKEQVLSVIETVGKGNVVVLAAFGPTSKVLAFELSGQSIQVIDMGQGIEVAYSDKKLYANLDVLV